MNRILKIRLFDIHLSLDMKKITGHPQYIRFRRWSRKNYAIFCSLGKHVTIGMLQKEVTEISVRKQVNSLYPNEAERNNCILAINEWEDTETDLFPGLSPLIPLITTTAKSAAHVARLYIRSINHYKNREETYSYDLSGSFI